MGTGVLSPGLKRSGREADHSPHLVPRLRMRGVVPQLAQYVFLEWYLVKHRENFMFYVVPGIKINKSSSPILNFHIQKFCTRVIKQFKSSHVGIFLCGVR